MSLNSSKKYRLGLGIEFVGAACAINDECGAGTKFLEDVGERLGECGSINTSELNVRACGVGERAEDIEDGALTDLFARADGVLHGGVEFCGEHKSDADVVDGVIEDAKFKTYGCGSAIASSSLVTEWVKGKTVDQAMTIRNTEIAEELALPPVKIHCSILAEDAIKAAVADYKKKHGE